VLKCDHAQGYGMNTIFFTAPAAIALLRKILEFHTCALGGWQIHFIQTILKRWLRYEMVLIYQTCMHCMCACMDFEDFALQHNADGGREKDLLTVHVKS
jgi:hypothetical protein